MVNLHKLQVGQTLYKVSRQQMGNTTLNSSVVHTYKVSSVETDAAGNTTVTVSHRGRTRTVTSNSGLTGYNTKKPTLKESFMGSWRKATKEEIAEAREKGTLRESGEMFYITREKLV